MTSDSEFGWIPQKTPGIQQQNMLLPPCEAYYTFASLAIPKPHLAESVLARGPLVTLLRSCQNVGEVLWHRIHVWYIYLYFVDYFLVNVGKYTLHGSYGMDLNQLNMDVTCWFQPVM